MKKLIISFLLLVLISSCQRQSILIEAKVTKVTPYYELKHYSLPHVTFSLLIRNRGNRAATLYVNHYGRDPSHSSGSYWVYYNNRRDSLELFSASCGNCYEKTTLQPEDSLDITLQIHYSNLAKNIAADSSELIDDEIREVFENWDVIKYFDNMRNPLFEVRRQN